MDSSRTIMGEGRPVVQSNTLGILLGLPEQVELQLSQIELMYRAEGNANLVVALPQFKKVLRLPKMLPNGSGRKTEERQQQLLHEQQQQQQLKRHEHHRQQPTTEKEQHYRTSVMVGRQKAKDDDLNMEDFLSYIEIIRCLLGNEFILNANLVEIPNDADRMWINESIKDARPAYRRDKEFCGQFGIMLPDATLLPDKLEILLSNGSEGKERAEVVKVQDTFAVEIKPKQGWLLPTDVIDLFLTPKSTVASCKPTQVEPTATTIETTPITTFATKRTKSEVRCRYCAMQFLKLRNNKISRRSTYCPIELFSGEPARMLNALHSLLECPQNNLRVFRNGNLIYGDHATSMSWHQLKETVLFGEFTIYYLNIPSENIQMLKLLLVSCLLKDYGECKTLATNYKKDDIVNIDQSKLINSAAEMMFEQSGSKVLGVCEKETQTQINEAEILCLPLNCILQKMLHLQLLAKRNLRHMWLTGNPDVSNKTYNAFRSLKEKHTRTGLETLKPEEEYLLGATTLDCSIMVTFKEIPYKIETNSLNPYHRSHLVQLPEFKKCFLTQVTLLDLDPKPDSHFHKYVQQTRQLHEYIEIR